MTLVAIAGGIADAAQGQQRHVDCPACKCDRPGLHVFDDAGGVAVEPTVSLLDAVRSGGDGEYVRRSPVVRLLRLQGDRMPDQSRCGPESEPRSVEMIVSFADADTVAVDAIRRDDTFEGRTIDVERTAESDEQAALGGRAMDMRRGERAGGSKAETRQREPHVCTQLWEKERIHARG